MCIFCSAKSLSVSAIFVATSLSSVQVAQTDIRVNAPGLSGKNAVSLNKDGGRFTCDVVGNTVAAVLRPADIMPNSIKFGS